MRENDDLDANDPETDSHRAPYPLAWGFGGDPLNVPPEVACWRVKRMGKGRPETLYDDTHEPLRIALTATAEDLAEAVDGVGGRYRLEPIDAEGRAVTTCSSAFARVSGSGASEDEGGGPPIVRALVDQTRALNTTVGNLTSALVARDAHVAQLISVLARVAERTKTPQPPDAELARLIAQLDAEAEAEAEAEASGGGEPAEPSAVQQVIDAIGGPEVLKAILPMLLAKGGSLAALAPPKAPPPSAPPPAKPADAPGPAAAPTSEPAPAPAPPAPSEGGAK